MTFSICAAVDGRYAAAVASKSIAVGSTVAFVSPKGAICTQASTNTPLGVRALRSLEEGSSLAESVPSLLESDPHDDSRQVHGVDGETTVAITGGDCVPWAGGQQGDGYTVAGNMLEEESVLTAMVERFEATAGESKPLDERVLEVLRAGEDAGGDKRREHAQSAALSVYDPDDPRLAHDLRVDEHDDAVAELERIHEAASALDLEWDERSPESNRQRHPDRS